MPTKLRMIPGESLPRCRGITNHFWLLLVILALLLGTTTAQAQKVYSIGSLNTADPFIDSFHGFRGRMAELGYREEQNVRYQYYNSRGNDELLRALAQKLVQDKLDLIVTSSTTATAAAAKASEGTRTPVLFLSAGNPHKLIKSFSSSGSNLTGISSASLELTGKRLELLKELAPRTKRIAMPINPKGTNYNAIVAEVSQAAGKFGLEISEIQAASVDELAKVIPTITRRSFDAIFNSVDSLVTEGIEIVLNQAIEEKLPFITSLLANVRRGALATYGADYSALGRQGAVLADKILKGTKPADLPIEMPQKLKLVLNLKTAKAIGLTIPKEILLRADEVIE